MSIYRHSLDYNQLYSLNLEYKPAQHQLEVTFENPDATRPRFVNAILSQLRLVEGSAYEKDAPFSAGKYHNGKITFSHVSREFTLCLSDEPIGTYNVSTTGNLSVAFHRPLTVDETRRMGTFHECPPYPMRRNEMSAEDNNGLVRTAMKSVFTDFHTHSSGQISASGLLDVALNRTKPDSDEKKPYYYPIDLLRAAGLDTSFAAIPASERKMIPRVPFPPLERAGETYPDKIEAADLQYVVQQDPHNLAILAAHMTLPANRQGTFADLEYRGNRFRYPLSKDSSLAAAIRKREAEEFVTQGIDFALTSFVGIDKPDTLRGLHNSVEDAKADPSTKNFTQRFMAGVPRGLQLPNIEVMLKKAQILLDSPYIMGIDMLGYESNKTEEFVHLLDQYADWASAHKPGSFIRVHAGENDKNHDNVKDFLKIAVKHPKLRFLIGHGVYGMDKETIRLLKQLGDRVTVELNPSSNIALNNADDVKQLPFTKLLENHIPFIVGSDCAGMYQTDAVQLGLAAYHADLDMEGFHILRANQQRLMQQMQEYSQDITATIPNWDTAKGKKAWLDGMSERIAAVQPAVVAPTVAITEAAIEAKLRSDRVTLIEDKKRPPELQGKFPVTIIGASGASWKRLTKGQQRENAIAIDMLIHVLGDNCYVVQGRNKKVGLSKVINQSLDNVNEERKANGQTGLYSIGLDVNTNFDMTHSYKHLTHMIRVHGPALDLPNAIVDHTFDNDGVLIAVGGAAYTRDTILEADQRGIHEKHPDNRKMMLLLGNTAGASAEKAALLHPDYKAVDGLQLVKKLFDNRPDLFPPGFKKSQFLGMYNEAKKRVDIHGYNMVDSGNTTIQLPAQRIATKQQQTDKERKQG